MSVFKCKMCGGALEIQAGETVAVCEYCGTPQTLPKLDDGRRANLYDRANHFRRANEFDKAASIYEQILNEDGSDAEAYWSLVLCRYGIEYVEDPATRRRVPTVNRAQFTSVFDDPNYKSALQYADAAQRAVYEDEAKAINDIQRGILAISRKEQPFDVFICYKETDANGRRTPDSVLANDLYHQLTQEGFKVFFSSITLEDKLGSAYEPYIFAALNSAKVMVVLGTRAEYFNAVWVKNEWSRYLALIRGGSNKTLIPAYKDMDPYDLPEEFSHLQAQDMGKLGFMQDLIRGIKKLTGNTDSAAVQSATATSNVGKASLLRRVSLFLEDGNWESANEYCEKVLDYDPECAEAYLGKLMAELHVFKREKLAECIVSFGTSTNCRNALRFADDKLRSELSAFLKQAESNAQQIERERQEKEKQAEEARILKEREEEEAKVFSEVERLLSTESYNRYERAIKYLETIPYSQKAQKQIGFCRQKIVEAKLEEEKLEKATKKMVRLLLIFLMIFVVVVLFCVVANFIIKDLARTRTYTAAMKQMEAGQYEEAYEMFRSLGDYKDSRLQASNANNTVLYLKAAELEQKGDIAAAAMQYGSLGNFQDAHEKSFRLWELIAVRDTISAASSQTAGLHSNGTVIAIGINTNGECEVSEWTDIVSICAGVWQTVGLCSDGTVVGTRVNYGGEYYAWKDIVSISAGATQIVGLCSDGTVVATGENEHGECNVSNWKNILSISAGGFHTAGLHPNGTVVATGDNEYGQCNVFFWTDVVSISAGIDHTVGLRSDGTVVATGNNEQGQCDVSEWTDIVSISAGYDHTVGLRSDGTVIATGNNEHGQCDISEWTDIVSISAGYDHTVGLHSDGTVVAAGPDYYLVQCDVSDWSDIKQPS